MFLHYGLYVAIVNNMNNTHHNFERGTTLRIIENNLAGRQRTERVFRALGLSAIIFSVACVTLLFFDIGRRGLSAFTALEIQLEVQYDAEQMGIFDVTDSTELDFADYRIPLREALKKSMLVVTGGVWEDRMYDLLSVDAELALQKRIVKDPKRLGGTETLWLKTNSALKVYLNDDRSDSPMRAWGSALKDHGILRTVFNRTFFSAGDSRNPESAGIFNALIGSAFSVLVCFLISFPIGVAGAIYLEEFASKNWWTDFVEININNLAAVPSIIFGLLGLAVFINLFGMPRSAPLTAGTVLALMTMPTIIISSRAAIKSVPPSIREAALGMGASHLQMVHSQVLPAAMPGMLTGAIIGLAGALGETAPLLMIGMVAFIATAPTSVLDHAVALPVQIFLWADSPEVGFAALTAAAIMVLVIFLIAMNATATILRMRLERRW